MLYAGTFSKTLFPALRMAYLVVPADLTEAFARSSRLRGCGCPPLLQAGVADFIRQGHFYRHLKRMRPLYRQRREWLTQALERQLGTWLTAVPQQGGIQLLARLRDGWRIRRWRRKPGNRVGGAGVVGLANRPSGGAGVTAGVRQFHSARGDGAGGAGAGAAVQTSKLNGPRFPRARRTSVLSL